MWQQEILELLDVLEPALKSRRKAFRLLQKHWSGKAVIIWTTEDLHRAANERETVLSEKEAQNLLRQLVGNHNPQYGLQWKDLYEAIQQTGSGRDITKRELNKFIHKDIIAIQKSSRSKVR